MKKFLAIAAVVIAFTSCEEKKVEGTPETPKTDIVTPTTPTTPDSTALKATADSLAKAAAATTTNVTEGANKMVESGKEAVKTGKEAVKAGTEAVKAMCLPSRDQMGEPQSQDRLLVRLRS